MNSEQKDLYINKLENQIFRACQDRCDYCAYKDGKYYARGKCKTCCKLYTAATPYPSRWELSKGIINSKRKEKINEDCNASCR